VPTATGKDCNKATLRLQNSAFSTQHLGKRKMLVAITSIA
jgi:hypothetical protein